MLEFWNNLVTTLTPFRVPIWIVVYIAAGFVIRWGLIKIIDRSVDEIVHGVKKRRGAQDTQSLAISSPLAAVRTVQRTRTIGSLLTNIVTVVVVIVVVFLIIGKVDPGILASLSLLSAAVGAGLGFGAQRIVGDVLNGLFMVVEDQLGVGDDVDMGLASGVVENVGIRVTQVRDVHGTLWFVRNGEVQRVGSNSQGWNRAIIDLAVPYDLDRDHIEEVMLETATTLADDPDWAEKFIERPSIWGLETLSAEAVVVRLVARTRAGARWDIERELRARLQTAFKDAHISLPPLNTIVLDGPNGLTPPSGRRPHVVHRDAEPQPRPRTDSDDEDGRS
ncbi:mechanosensitive ion channel [Pseudoclavibacter chungangensis]|uniref:Mechanosensitive ion channel n=1 Tax=Pseudoclavibacter chungangensis TaxID=587635 RepID=A0A7J5BRC7_9MICO|nr:mechanosensitive ion channel domain-containing protein [Pseudoclavibacter chungangensis]KAB1656852.1 mechanosensitive ion channel [Pseudoclavibacter chungangensis]NYJ67315.1 small conductance mechanosensitive channel [Pseudoclavibacter chungangensis]